MNNGFYETVSVGSLVAKDLLNYALSMPPESWVKYYNFEAIPVHPNLLLHDSFLSYLAKKRAFYAGILRMPPNTCYNWHVDTDRKVGLNMLLADDNKSRCLFIEDEKPGLVFTTKELKYQPGTYYVFNTQKPHMVLNTTQPRYLFSLEFTDKDSELTFDELCLDLKG
jgi:hypothetical protein